MLGNSCGWAWQTVRAVPPPTPPLKAAILNVTSDFDQVGQMAGGRAGCACERAMPAKQAAGRVAVNDGSAQNWLL